MVLPEDRLVVLEKACAGLSSSQSSSPLPSLKKTHPWNSQRMNLSRTGRLGAHTRAPTERLIQVGMLCNVFTDACFSLRAKKSLVCADKCPVPDLRPPQHPPAPAVLFAKGRQRAPGRSGQHPPPAPGSHTPARRIWKQAVEPAGLAVAPPELLTRARPGQQQVPGPRVCGWPPLWWWLGQGS